MKHAERLPPLYQHAHLSNFDTDIFLRPVVKYASSDEYQAADKVINSFVYISERHDLEKNVWLKNNAFDLIGTHSEYCLPSIIQNSYQDLYPLMTNASRAEQAIMVDCFAPSLQLVSHYYHNPSTQSKSLAIYKQWLANSFTGYADHYAYIRLEGVIAGIITLKNKHDFLFIDLLAVHPLFRSKGVAKALINYAIRYAHERDFVVKVVTQADNIPANRLYQKSGFLVTQLHYIFFKVEQ